MRARISALEPPFDDCVVIGIPLSRPPGFGELTKAEIDVAEGLLAGHSMRELAARRKVSIRTVGHQVESVYRKLGISSRYELVAIVTQRRPAQATTTR